MNYKNTIRGIFKDRPNRFIAHVQIGDQLETVHVKNTGRCRELLVPETEVILEKSDNPARKTKYDLICVNKGAAGSIWIPRPQIKQQKSGWQPETFFRRK